jgi:hypothetical protein
MADTVLLTLQQAPVKKQSVGLKVKYLSHIFEPSDFYGHKDPLKDSNIK